MTAPVLQHVALSVRDIDTSADWYARLFDLTLVAEFDEPAPMKVFMTPDRQAIDLRQDPDVEREPFSQRHVGLDHVAFVCQDRAELDAWAEKLAEHHVDERRDVDVAADAAAPTSAGEGHYFPPSFFRSSVPSATDGAPASWIFSRTLRTTP